MAGSTRLAGRQAGGAPVYAYQRRPGLPPVSIMRMHGGTTPKSGLPHHPHAHDFLVLAYLEKGGGLLRIDDRDWQIRAGDAFVIAPGEVIQIGATGGLEATEGWAAFFPPDVLEPHTAGAFLSWRAHPLLYPFVGGLAGGAQRLHVPPADRRKTRRTVQRGIAERRMIDARRLLAGTDLTAEAVANRIGYRDASYFIRTFKSHHGVTPQEWRRA